MVAIVLVAHAPVASALREVAAHVFDNCDACLQAVDISPDMDGEAVRVALSACVQRAQVAHEVRGVASEVLILSDVFGATPCNGAQKLLNEHADLADVALVTGLNVPMLWRAVGAVNTEGATLAHVVARAVDGATNGVMQIQAVSTH